MQVLDKSGYCKARFDYDLWMRTLHEKRKCFYVLQRMPDGVETSSPRF
ncbi:hypothetical protein [Methanosarcina sp. UBA289]|nr:hypothetical protein [Methanosarcina sp. UBA289]